MLDLVAAVVNEDASTDEEDVTVSSPSKFPVRRVEACFLLASSEPYASGHGFNPIEAAGTAKPKRCRGSLLSAWLLSGDAGLPESQISAGKISHAVPGQFSRRGIEIRERQWQDIANPSRINSRLFVLLFLLLSSLQRFVK